MRSSLNASCHGNDTMDIIKLINSEEEEEDKIRGCGERKHENVRSIPGAAERGLQCLYCDSGSDPWLQSQQRLEFMSWPLRGDANMRFQ